MCVDQYVSVFEAILCKHTISICSSFHQQITDSQYCVCLVIFFFISFHSFGVIVSFLYGMKLSAEEEEEKIIHIAHSRNIHIHIHLCVLSYVKTASAVFICLTSKFSFLFTFFLGWRNCWHDGRGYFFHLCVCSFSLILRSLSLSSIPFYFSFSPLRECASDEIMLYLLLF